MSEPSDNRIECTRVHPEMHSTGICDFRARASEHQNAYIPLKPYTNSILYS